MTRDPALVALLQRLPHDLDQQTALCRDLWAAMPPGRAALVGARVSRDSEYGDTTSAAVAQFAMLGLLVATRAWQGDGTEGA